MASEKQEYELTKPAFEALRSMAVGGGHHWIYVEAEDCVLVFLNTDVIFWLEKCAAAQGRTPSEWIVWYSQIRWN